MTYPIQPHPHGAGNPAYFMERVAAVGVAAAWTKHNRNKRAAAGDIGGPSNLLDDPQYPDSWDAYIGQYDAKSMLQDAIRRSIDRNEHMRHVLIACPEPGIGKTALAVLVARALGGRCFTISGTPTKTDVDRLLAQLRNGDVLFIDEIHRLAFGGKGKAEWLLHLLENGAVVGPGGVRELRITVIGATTDVGILPATLIDRFGIKPVLERYTPNQACILALNMAQRMFPPLPIPRDEELALYARAADGNPRRIRQLLEYAIDQHYSSEPYNVETVLSRARMTWDGLDWSSQRYLVLLRQSVGAMGEGQLKSLLQEPSLTYLEHRLYDRGFLTFTKGGRVLTTEGAERATELIAAGVDL